MCALHTVRVLHSLAVELLVFSRQHHLIYYILIFDICQSI